METLTSGNPQVSDSEDEDQVPVAQTVSPDDDTPEGPETSVVPPSKMYAARRLWHRVPKGAKVRGAAEVIGVGVDAALMGAGSAGVNLMKDVLYREVAATAPEVAVIDRILHHGKHEHTEKDARRLLAKMGGVAVGVTVAVVSQKAGIDIAHQLHDGMNHGFGHFAIPLTSKIGAMTGLSAVRRNISRFI